MQHGNVTIRNTLGCLYDVDIADLAYKSMYGKSPAYVSCACESATCWSLALCMFERHLTVYLERLSASTVYILDVDVSFSLSTWHCVFSASLLTQH